MDRKGAIIAVLGALGTLVTILGASGAKAIEALAGVPLVLRAWADGLPFGLWSFGLALALATLVWAVSIRVFPVGKCGKAPFGLSNLMAFMIGPSVTPNVPAGIPGQLWTPKTASTGNCVNRPSSIMARAPAPPSSAG